jgi:hypothetical protein
MSGLPPLPPSPHNSASPSPTPEQMIAHLQSELARVNKAGHDIEVKYAQLLSTQSSSSSSSAQPAISQPIYSASSGDKPVRPESFSGDRSKLDQFLLQLDLYLDLTNYTRTLNHTDQVKRAQQFLKDGALQWFASIQLSEQPFTSIEDFKTRIRLHIAPHGISKTTRAKLKTLKQTHSLQAYNTLFLGYMIHLPNMDPEDAIEHYRSGLRTNLQDKISDKEFTTINEIMDAVVLIDQRMQHQSIGNRSTSSFRSSSSSAFFVNPSSSGSSTTSSTSAPMDLSVVEQQQQDTELNAINGPLKKLTEAERQQLMREGKCFRCRQRGHMSRDCPKSQHSKNVSSQQ